MLKREGIMCGRERRTCGRWHIPLDPEKEEFPISGSHCTAQDWKASNKQTGFPQLLIDILASINIFLFFFQLYKIIFSRN